MACFGKRSINGGETPIKIRRAKPWKHSKPITFAKLCAMREEFWDTAPQAGGDKEIWCTLKKAAWTLVQNNDLDFVQSIVDSACIIVQKSDLTVCRDSKGFRYELPKYVLHDPTNLVRNREIDNCMDTRIVYNPIEKRRRRTSPCLVRLIYVLPLLMCFVYLIYGYK